ncbi:MAG: M20/M25/M40 family metallo-hydrolase [Deltaproteobacteria bacterium]|uniref:M20/M25/M40 family metallo-hydrolase n=1 Tax=Candidatus Zymogenus saltonus TaxID=2844893 RepID=A0A9D8PNK4_9DELT|nr:M20/M25/M40 family metallo-hydrolase [Candidatus Zymogenus saltonus]
MLKTKKKDAIHSLQSLHLALEDSFDGHLKTCRDFLRQKSVSATGEGIREMAQVIRGFIDEMGGGVKFGGDPAYPIIHGRINRNRKKTLIIYGMYDVQPAEENNWISPPFAAEVHNLPGLGECIVARGAVNSKGALCGLFNVLRTMNDLGEIPLNIIFTIEGEEEIGSPHFEEFIVSHKGELSGSGAVDFDFSQDSVGNVSMHLGLKGIVYMDLICRGGKKGGPGDTSLHGSDSAWVSSPVWRLIHALGPLTDEKENIKIPGFYENVANPNEEDNMLLKKLALTFDEKRFLKEMRSAAFKSAYHGYELLRQGLYSPVLNINGFHSGYTGAGTKTILPRKATAKVDIRFGPRMEPDEVIRRLKDYLVEQGFDDIDVIVREKYTWSKIDYSEPIVQKMISAYQAHDIEPEVWPIATWTAPYFVFSRILGLPVVSGGLGHGGREHVANEYMTVRGLLDFEKFVATFLYQMAE